MSLRGKMNIREILREALKNTEGTGDGHEHACGGTINTKDLHRFKSNLINILNKKEEK